MTQFLVGSFIDFIIKVITPQKEINQQHGHIGGKYRKKNYIYVRYPDILMSDRLSEKGRHELLKGRIRVT